MPPTWKAPNFPFQRNLSTHFSYSNVLLSSATVKNSNLQSVRGGVTTEIAFKRSVYIQGLKTNSRLRFSLYVHFCVDLNWFLRSSYRFLSSLILAKQQPPFDLRVPHERVILQKLEKDLFALVVVPLLSNSLLSNLCTNFYALTMPTPCQSSEQISFLKYTKAIHNLVPRSHSVLSWNAVGDLGTRLKISRIHSSRARCPPQPIPATHGKHKKQKQTNNKYNKARRARSQISILLHTLD